MEIEKQEKYGGMAVRFSAREAGSEVGRAYLFFIYNDLHDRPYGLLEDLFVDDVHRGAGIGTALARAVLEEARARGCYKLIGQSRYGRDDVHAFYERLGFRDHGKNFRYEFL